MFGTKSQINTVFFTPSLKGTRCFIIFLSFNVIQIAPEYKRRKAIRRCFSRTQTRNETFGQHKKKEGLEGFISESRNDVNGLLHESIPQLSSVRYRPKI